MLKRDPERDPDERVKLPLDPEDALRACSPSTRTTTKDRIRARSGRESAGSLCCGQAQRVVQVHPVALLGNFAGPDVNVLPVTEPVVDSLGHFGANMLGPAHFGQGCQSSRRLHGDSGYGPPSCRYQRSVGYTVPLTVVLVSRHWPIASGTGSRRVPPTSANR